MTRKQMIEVKCDRCKRIEYVPASSKETDKAKLELRFRPSGKKPRVKEVDLELEFDDLCSPCENTVKNLIESIAREIKGKSPDRSEAKGEGAEDDPSIETGTTQLSVAPS